MTGDDGLAALLYQHQMFDGLNFDHCECGERIGTEWEDMAAHQAAVIRAAGWVKGCEEWAVRDSDRVWEVEPPSRHDAECVARAQNAFLRRAGRAEDNSVVSRIVTEWEPAETGDHE